ncbi:PREDICTED: protein BANP isoform X10 [Bison bison bison]|uniref:Protein BANP n=1 Tax=Bison bison bison TaxID=43346 RepID=A0A6P3HHB7_BISBB|nr:PREDICTED: protein BANP isoform X10 [Bison bison bison]
MQGALCDGRPCARPRVTACCDFTSLKRFEFRAVSWSRRLLPAVNVSRKSCGKAGGSVRVPGAVPGRRQNTIVVKVPGQEDSHNEDGESGSEASDSVSNCGQSGSQNIGNNVTLITLNSEEDYPNGTWLGDENNPEMRVRCAIIPSDMLHISTNCRTAEKMALTLLDYLFHREVQAVSNLSGQGKHGKKQLDPLTIYGIRCHLFYKFGITESDWYRIKQSIDSKCRTAWRRKQRGQSLAVKSFSRRTPSSSSYGASGQRSLPCDQLLLVTLHIQELPSPGWRVPLPPCAGRGRQRWAQPGLISQARVYLPAETMMSTPPPSSELQQPPPQALHYALANAQQVQIHQIGEDGQVQVIPQGHLHIAQVPQGEQVQITQDSEGNLQIHHVGQDGQVLQGAQLIAVASSDPAATGVDGSPLQGSDIQVQYVQLAPVTDHTTAAQVGPPFGKCTGPGAPAGVDTLGPFYLGPSSVRKAADALQPTLQPEMQLEHGAIQIQ